MIAFLLQSLIERVSRFCSSTGVLEAETSTSECSYFRGGLHIPVADQI